MNGQMPGQNTGYMVYQSPKRKRDHSTLVIVLSVVLAVVIGFFGFVFLIVSTFLKGLALDINDYDEVTAKVVSSEKKWSELSEKYVYANVVEYRDKNNKIFVYTLVEDIPEELGTEITIYCDPEDYNNVVYMNINDLAAMKTFFSIFTTISITLLVCAGLVLAAGIIIGVIMKKRYKAYLAQTQSSFAGFPGQPGQMPPQYPQNNNEQ